MDEVTFKTAVKYAKVCMAISPLRDKSSAETLVAVVEDLPSDIQRGALIYLIGRSRDHIAEWDAMSALAIRSLRDPFAAEVLPTDSHLDNSRYYRFPVELAEWLADVLEGKRNRPSKGSDRFYNRDMLMGEAIVELVRRFDIRPTRSKAKKNASPEHCCAEGGSACDVVGVARDVHGYGNVERIWRKVSKDLDQGTHTAFRGPFYEFVLANSDKLIGRPKTER